MIKPTNTEIPTDEEIKAWLENPKNLTPEQKKKLLNLTPEQKQKMTPEQKRALTTNINVFDTMFGDEKERMPENDEVKKDEFEIAVEQPYHHVIVDMDTLQHRNGIQTLDKWLFDTRHDKTRLQHIIEKCIEGNHVFVNLKDISKYGKTIDNNRSVASALNARFYFMKIPLKCKEHQFNSLEIWKCNEICDEMDYQQKEIKSGAQMKRIGKYIAKEACKIKIIKEFHDKYNEKRTNATKPKPDGGQQ